MRATRQRFVQVSALPRNSVHLPRPVGRRQGTSASHGRRQGGPGGGEGGADGAERNGQGRRPHRQDLLTAVRRPALLVTSSMAPTDWLGVPVLVRVGRDLIKAVRKCRTAAEERALIAKESAAMRAEFRDQVRPACAPWPLPPATWPPAAPPALGDEGNQKPCPPVAAAHLTAPCCSGREPSTASGVQADVYAHDGLPHPLRPDGVPEAYLRDNVL